MKKILVVFSTKEGQTEKITNAIIDDLIQDGNHVDVINSDRFSFPVPIEVYDGIIIGASVHLARYSKPFCRWINANAPALNMKPTAFFSVCLGILQTDNDMVQAKERSIAESLFHQSQWQPTIFTIFAGALSYSKYNWFTRRLMQMIAARTGGDTDTTHDHEYTDWKQVHHFVKEFEQTIEKPHAHLAPKPGLANTQRT